LHVDIGSELNAHGWDNERSSVVYILGAQFKYGFRDRKLTENRKSYRFLKSGKVFPHCVCTLKSCMLKVLMKLPLLSFTAMEEEDL